MAAPDHQVSGAAIDAPQRRGPSMLLVILLIAVASAAVATAAGLAVVSVLQARTLLGTKLSPITPAANFTLKDAATGQVRSLAAFKGKVVSLTFLYTHCPDVCPLIAGKLSQADQELGTSRNKVEMLAVSGDPNGDTPQTVQAFDQAHGLTLPNWHYFIGTAQQLVPVWRAYYIGSDAAAAPSAAGKVSKATPQLINHTAIVYLIDPQGRLRVALDASFTIGEFIHDVKALSN
ncbi:MAG: SCO family protein [Chloroflexi bacterium]|nr:SCO family protein [Chloroflexota bacterium]